VSILESHARRSTPAWYSATAGGERTCGKIKNRKLGAGGFFSCREVYLKGWSGWILLRL